MEDKKEKIKYKTQVIKLIDSFLNGGSTTANPKSLSHNQIDALSYLSEQGICICDFPDKDSAPYERLDENDKAGRYRVAEDQVFKANRLRGFFQTEIKNLLKD